MKFRLAGLLAAAALVLGAGSVAGSATASADARPRCSRTATGFSDRPTADDLRGRVVVVDIFTFGCYNCKNVTPNLRAPLSQAQ